MTLRTDNASVVRPRIDLLTARAGTPFVSKVLGPGAKECDLVARTVVAGHAVAYLLQAGGQFVPDDGSPALADAALRALARTAGQEVTYTCVPSGWARAR